MSLKHQITLILTLTYFYGISYATPNVEIIQSCKNLTAANSNVTMTELSQPVANEFPDANCEDQYETSYDNKKYGHVSCNNEPYLIVASAKYKLNTANNLSVNPSVQPNIPLLATSGFWKIDKGSDSYLCVFSVLSNAGTASHAIQYYIVEHAFDTVSPIALNFYFFDKDIAPLFP